MAFPVIEVISGVFKPIADYFTKRQEIKAQEHENQLGLLKAQGERQAALASQGLTADAAWEQVFANQSAQSWKDEFELLVLSTPLALCFVNFGSFDGAAIVRRGFEAIQQTPTWFQFLVITIYLANYGIRYWRKTQSDT